MITATDGRVIKPGDPAMAGVVNVSELMALKEKYAADYFMWRERIVALEEERDGLKLDVARTAIYSTGLSVSVYRLKRTVEDFAKGVSATTWTTNEPRIVGFKAEFDKMVDALVEKAPELPTREAMKALMDKLT